MIRTSSHHQRDLGANRDRDAALTRRSNAAAAGPSGGQGLLHARDHHVHAAGLELDRFACRQVERLERPHPHHAARRLVDGATPCPLAAPRREPVRAARIGDREIGCRSRLAGRGGRAHAAETAICGCSDGALLQDASSRPGSSNVRRIPTLGGHRALAKHERYGGPSRNRTGVQGFAVLCVTTPPSGQRAIRGLCPPGQGSRRSGGRRGCFRRRAGSGAWRGAAL